jgi:hypothetical protein
LLFQQQSQRTDHGTKITDRTYMPETNTAVHLSMRSG